MDELLAEVKAARRATDARKRHTARIKELLIQVRLSDPDLTVADLEAKIGRFYDRATISRITFPAIKGAADPPVAES
jgi:hypothetical protein